MKLIDFEHHFYDQSTIDAMKMRKGYPKYDEKENTIHWTKILSMPQGPVLLKSLLDISEKRVEFMDQLGITTAVISTAQGVEDVDTAESVELARKTNDTVYELTKRFPGRFLGSAVLPSKNVKEAVKELERCVKELGFVCWHTHSNYGTASPEQEEFLPLFRKAAELNVYVYLHPAVPKIESLEPYGFTMAGPGAGFTVDTMLTILKMIVSGLFDRVPETRLLLGHLGEAIPFLLERIDNRLNFVPNVNLKNAQKPSYYFKNNIMVTTSGNMSKEAFECTQKVFGIDSILFGSDYPFEDAADMVKFVESLPLSVEDREKLYYKNAEKLGVI